MLNFGSGCPAGLASRRIYPRLCATLAWLLFQLPLTTQAEPTPPNKGSGASKPSQPVNAPRAQLAQAAPPPAASPAPAQPAPPTTAPAAPPPAAEPTVPPPEAAPAEPPAEAQPLEAAPAPEGEVATITETPEALVPEDDAADKPVAEGALGEIVVTAARRETTLQKYAGAATAMTQEDLDRKNIKSVRDVANATPSVTIGTQESNVEVYIRGVGTDNNTEIGDPTVATHIDGVYIPRPRGVGSMLFDMERLEIGRGPQGTLRGRNAVAGTLNIITNKPVLGETLGDASFQLGNYSQRLARGMVNIPFGDRIALRVAGFGEVRDPFFKNGGPVRTIVPTESGDTLAYRASLLIKPVDMLKISLAHDFMQDKGTGYSGANFLPALQAGLLPEEVTDPRSVLFRGPQPSQKLQHWGFRGNIDLDLGPVLVELISSYRQLGFEQVSSGNVGVNYPGRNVAAENYDDWGTSYWQAESKSIVQELRVYAPPTSRLRWTAGGFFSSERQKVFLGATTDNTNGYSGQEFNMPSVKNHSLAGYVDAIFDILEQWRATGGLRISSENKSRDGIGYQYQVDGLMSNARFGTEGFRFKGFDRTDFTANDGAPGSDLLNGIASFGGRDTLQTALMQPGVMLASGRLLEQHGTYDARFVDFRLGTDYDLTKDNMVYVQFATGHKSGGFNDTILVEDRPVAPTYKPEALYSTEIGSRNKFLDGKLAANVTAFWYHYVDQQFKAIQEILSSGIEGKAGASNLQIINATNSRILGVEAEVAARLPFGLRADLAATLLDARFTNGEVADTRLGWSPAEQTMTPLSGNQLPRAPVLSVNYALSQKIPTSFGKFDWNVSAQTRSVQYMTVFNGDGRDARGNVNPNLSDKVPSYTRVDINIGYTIPNGRLRIDAFVLNLTDVIYMTSLINTPNLNLRFFNPPRQIGARLTVTL